MDWFHLPDRNRWRRSSEADGIPLRSWATLDGKHIAMIKPKKSGSEYYNYKGFFSLVLLALGEAEHSFLLVDVRSSGSSLDAQSFNQSKLREKIKDGS